VLEREFAAAQRGRPLTVLLVDADNFKYYNDRAGHQAGDEALRAVATTLAGQTRAMNLAARLGGDEFVAVLSGSDREGGLVHAARIGHAIEANPLLGPIGVRATIGVASFDASMTSPDDLLRAADRDMYAQKSGRRG
jgi:diguanylate cyclase (GGDEF)-like protein